MKKNYTIVFTAVLALIALCAFLGCDSGGDDDGSSLPLAEVASLGTGEITLAEGAQVYNEDGTPYTPGTGKTVRPESGDVGSSYADAVAAVSGIDAAGKLTLKLPVFTSLYWDAFGGTTMPAGLTANPSDVKLADMTYLHVDGGALRLRRNNTNGRGVVSYTYVDKDAVITGEFDDHGETIFANLILKLGWNLVIEGRFGSNTAMVTGSPGDGYRWEVYD
ncbi:MAG: hypothetical protein LBK08_01115 [Treponema sp.]|jgi:hypothetical protein|nr:hypothetical protein [Treponema sp.]